MHTLKVGDRVLVTDPKHEDSLHQHSFAGRVVAIRGPELIVDVVDGDDDVWSVSLDEIDGVLLKE